MQTIAIIGSSMIGESVARLAVAAGYNVIISNSRGPETLTGRADRLGPRVRAATSVDAIRGGDIIVAAVPFSAYEQLPADELAGEIVIDTTNYYPMRDGAHPEVQEAAITTSELVQRHLKDSKVVKALNNQDFMHLLLNAAPEADPERTTLPIAGDDAAAKEAIIESLSTLVFDALDIGPLAESWRSEPNTQLDVHRYVPDLPAGCMSNTSISRRTSAADSNRNL
ncbi:hypothetical protein AZG88_38165 [Rhodococcus sp. LB1]|nr:hypothetical protein AZG88_38165 [Rhodococcus sp. LB1]